MAVNVRDYIAENYGLFINGEFVKGSSDETIEVTNQQLEKHYHILQEQKIKMSIMQSKWRKRHLNHGH